MTTDNGQGDSDDDASVTTRILREQLEAIGTLVRTCEQIRAVLDQTSHRLRLELLEELYFDARDAADALHAFAVLVNDLRRADGGGP